MINLSKVIMINSGDLKSVQMGEPSLRLTITDDWPRQAKLKRVGLGKHSPTKPTNVVGLNNRRVFAYTLTHQKQTWV